MYDHTKEEAMKTSAPRIVRLCVVLGLLLGLAACDGSGASDAESQSSLTSQCTLNTSCQASCKVDDDCAGTPGTICCNFNEFGKACLPLAECPSTNFCEKESDCPTSQGKTCCHVSAGFPEAMMAATPTKLVQREKVCAEPGDCLKGCTGNADCASEGLGFMCCKAFAEPVCYPLADCPATCETSADCPNQPCCTNFENPRGIYAASVKGLCQDSCRQACTKTSDCGDKICCGDGYCHSTCASSCSTEADCDTRAGEVCCDNFVSQSPWWPTSR